MNLELYQWISIPVLLIFIVISVRQFARGRSKVNELFFWVGLWVLTLVVVIFPDEIAALISDRLGIKDRVNAILFIGIGILYFLVFRLFLLLKRQNQAITELLRQIALDEEEVKRKDK